MVKWSVIENIAIYVLVVAGIVWSRTGWPLFLLLFVNFSSKKEGSDD